jgi:hypothetical protein
MSSSTLTEDRLSPKEQSFLDGIKTQAAQRQGKIALAELTRDIEFCFEVPKDFTQQEFDRVGRELTALHWRWKEIHRGQFGWSFVLFPI